MRLPMRAAGAIAALTALAVSTVAGGELLAQPQATPSKATPYTTTPSYTAQSNSGQPPSAAAFDDLYRRGHKASAGLQTLTARFTETTTSSLLTRPLVAHGTLAVQRPSRVMMRFTDPEPRVVLIDGDKMTTSWPGRNVRETSNISSTQGRIQKFFANDSPAELRRQFEIELRSTSERPGTHEVVLTPKRKQIRETLTRLDLWVDTSSFLLHAIRMTFANGDTKTMTFEDVESNVTLEPGTFTITP